MGGCLCLGTANALTTNDPRAWLLSRRSGCRVGGAAAAVAFGEQAAMKGLYIWGECFARAGHRVGQRRVVAGRLAKLARVPGPELVAFVQRRAGAGPVARADAAFQEQSVTAVQVDAVILHVRQVVEDAALDAHGLLKRLPGFIVAAQFLLRRADLHPGLGQLHAARI